MQKKRIMFFNINGSGMGHMSRCLAYARRLRGQADISFFSLASAVEFIEEMGFQAEYFVSPFWSSNDHKAWNTELAYRLGLFLEHVRPHGIVFDGTWPYVGFLAACRAYGEAKIVWSYRGLFKKSVKKAPIDEKKFALVIKPGELGSYFSEQQLSFTSKKVFVPPVTLLEDSEIYDRQTARTALGLDLSRRYVLLSLGPGNLKDVHGLGHRLIQHFHQEGFAVVLACAPISVQDVELPPSVLPLSVYPLVQYMRAFDVFVGAAGYNTCCEVVQTAVPTLFIPNTLVADDQVRRAHLVASHMPAVVSACETEEETACAVQHVLSLLLSTSDTVQASFTLPLDGAERAAQAILDIL